MTNAKRKNLRLSETIELHHLRMFEHSRKEIESHLEEARRVNDTRYDDIGKRFEESRVKFEGALAELRQLNRRLDSSEMSWNEDLKLREQRFDAGQAAAEARLVAERLAAEARQKETEARLIAERKEFKQEFNSYRRWMFVNILMFLGVLVALVALYFQILPNLPLFAS